MQRITKIHPVRKERLLKGWTQQELADFVAVGLRTIERVERGEVVGIATIQRLCQHFNKTPKELELVWTEADRVVSLESNEISYTYGEENQDTKTNESEEAMNRRKATKDIAMLIGGALLSSPKDLLQPQPWAKFSNLVRDSDIDNFSQFQRLLDASWHLLKASDLDVLERVLESYLPRLEELTVLSSKHHEKVSALTAQAYEIKGILASHQLNLEKRAQYHQKAVKYGLQAKDHNVQMSALIQLASAFQYLKQPLKVLQTYQMALPLVDQGSPLLGSCVYLGLADVSAQCEQEQEAITYLRKAREKFPRNPEDDPAYLFSDAGFFSLALYEGLTYLGMDKPKEAWSAFAQMENFPRSSTPERVRVEIVNLQAETAIAEGDLDKFRDRIIEGRNGAVALGSEKRYQEALSAYKQAKLVWRGESRVKELSDLFVR